MRELRKVRFVLELTEDIDDFLNEEAETAGTTKSEVLRKSIALLKAAIIGRQQGRSLAFIDPASEKVVGHIAGL